MNTPDRILDLLCDPQVRAYFLQLLDSPISGEEKYQRFLEFTAGRLTARSVIPAVSQKTAALVEDRDALLQQTAQAVRRAVRRVVRSQHQDGGWGVWVEQSSFWHTAYAVLFLNAARETFGLSVSREVEEILRRGISYLERHPENWAVDTVPTTAGMSIYDISLMVRCFYRVGRTYLRRESAARIYRGIDRLYRSQNGDGGWDANIWGYEVATPIRVWSEVGATASALVAMAETHDDRFLGVMEKGIGWLVSTQNPDGSWNDGSCAASFPAFQISGEPSLVKTCDALTGILSGSGIDIPLRPYQACVDQAIDWLCDRALSVLNRQHHLTGLGSGFTTGDYETITLILETLLRLPDSSHALLAPCTAWLLQGQRCQEDDPEDGSWILGHTARISLALTSFYRRMQEGMSSPQMPWVL